jgi:hypothetical protein
MGAKRGSEELFIHRQNYRSKKIRVSMDYSFRSLWPEDAVRNVQTIAGQNPVSGTAGQESQARLDSEFERFPPVNIISIATIGL